MTAGSGNTGAPGALRKATPGDRAQRGLAKGGWLVEIVLIPEGKTDPRFFAVGMAEARDAEEAILRYPGIVRQDERNVRRRLSDAEIAFLKLRESGVKPYSPRFAAGSDR